MTLSQFVSWVFEEDEEAAAETGARILKEKSKNRCGMDGTSSPPATVRTKMLIVCPKPSPPHPI
eukprot:11579431-Karenia_brevis.AAC.1